MVVKTRSTAKKCIVCYKIETFPKFFSCSKCNYKTSVCLDCTIKMLKMGSTPIYSADYIQVGAIHDFVKFACPCCRTSYKVMDLRRKIYRGTNDCLLRMIKDSRKSIIKICCNDCKKEFHFETATNNEGQYGLETGIFSV